MRPNRLKVAFDRGEVAVNAWLSSDSRYAAEALSHAGYDSITVDLQHGMFGMDSAIGLLQAVSAGPAMPMARCAALEPAEIGKLLDAGAYAIVCPSIDTPAQAAAFVAACRYPPTGTRSFGPSRGLLYGGSDYVVRADETVMTWAMIESAAALAVVDEIVATPGLDGVYVGPNDLALSLGATAGLTEFPSVVEAAITRVLTAAHAAGRYAGIFCADAMAARRLALLGWDLVTPGNDIGNLKRSAAHDVRIVRHGGDEDGVTDHGATGGY